MPRIDRPPPKRQEWTDPSDCEDCRRIQREKSMSVLKRPLRKRRVSGTSASRSSLVVVDLHYNFNRDKLAMDPTAVFVDPSPDEGTPALVVSDGPYWPKRPTLAEILAGTSDEPWTLEAFEEYAEQNLCLENLQFIFACKAYEDEWSSATAERPDAELAEDNPRFEDLRSAWKALLHTYIHTNGTREVNLPGDIRAKLVDLAEPPTPPRPTVLAEALSKTYELIEDSILFSFLNAVQPPSALSELDMHAGDAAPRTRLMRPIIVPSPRASNNSLYSKSALASSRYIPSPSRPLSFSPSEHGSAASVERRDAEPSTVSPRHFASPPVTPLAAVAPLVMRRRPSSRSQGAWDRVSSRFGLRKKKTSDSPSGTDPAT